MHLHQISDSPGFQSDLDRHSLYVLLNRDDWSKLTEEEFQHRYHALCRSLALDPNTIPFDMITHPDGRVGPYVPGRTAFSLAAKHGVSTLIKGHRLTRDEITYEVTADNGDGSPVTRAGSVTLYKKQGQARADAFMWAETKASRRAILAKLGIGFLDESEARDIEGATLQHNNETGDGVLESIENLATLPQLRWYNAQKRRLGWTEREEQVLLAKFGVARADEVERHDTFTALIRSVQDPDALTAIRSELAANDAEVK